MFFIPSWHDFVHYTFWLWQQILIWWIKLFLILYSCQPDQESLGEAQEADSEDTGESENSNEETFTWPSAAQTARSTRGRGRERSIATRSQRRHRARGREQIWRQGRGNKPQVGGTSATVHQGYDYLERKNPLPSFTPIRVPGFHPNNVMLRVPTTGP